MKKITVFLFLIIGTLMSFTTLAVNKKIPKKSQNAARNHNSVVKYGHYYNIPFNGEIPNVESFGFKKSDGIKRVEQIAYSNEYIGFGAYTLEFDKDGRLVLYESIGDDWYHPERYIFTYNDEGKLSTLNYLYIDGAQDNIYSPFINEFYEYKWSGDKLVEISEKLLIDQGINYNGQPTRLVLSYNDKGDLISAICKENPKIYFKFDLNNQVISCGDYSPNYKNQLYYNSSPTGFDSLFYKVNKKKVPLNWFYSTYTTSFKEIQPEFYVENWNDYNFKKPIISNDSKGNWIKVINKDDEGIETVFERSISYYD